MKLSIRELQIDIFVVLPIFGFSSLKILLGPKIVLVNLPEEVEKPTDVGYFVGVFGGGGNYLSCFLNYFLVF